MADIIINQRQLDVIHSKFHENENIDLAKQNWFKLTEEEKQLVISLIEVHSPKDSKLLQEKWYNTVMDVLGLVDPTPIVDTINSISYFSQGETLFGILTLIGAIPGYVGDIVTKPVVGSLKIGGKASKELKAALDLAKLGKTAEATSKLKILAKEPGIAGTFLRSSDEWGPKAISWIDKLPAGPFKGLKNTIRDYFALLTSAGKKSQTFNTNLKFLLQQPTTKNLTTSIPLLQKYLKNTSIFKTADLTKPGFFSNIFFGGVPKIFRSPEGRGIRMLMSKTKFWLGFLDYLGLGNWVGPEELSKKLGGDENMAKKMEEYQRTDKAKKYFDEEFRDSQTQTEPQPSSDEKTDSPSETQSQGSDPLSGFFQSLLGSQALRTAIKTL